jgi:hypothetical protein
MPAKKSDVSPPNRKKAVRMKEGNRVLLEAACTIAQKHDANAILVYADVIQDYRSSEAAIGPLRESQM